MRTAVAAGWAGPSGPPRQGPDAVPGRGTLGEVAGAALRQGFATLRKGFATLRKGFATLRKGFATLGEVAGVALGQSFATQRKTAALRE